jgi:hypothetical protein
MLVLALDGGLVAAGLPAWGSGATLVLALTALSAVLAGIVVGFLALGAIVEGERSLVLLGPLLFAVISLMFVVGELVSPV